MTIPNAHTVETEADALQFAREFYGDAARTHTSWSGLSFAIENADDLSQWGYGDSWKDACFDAIRNESRRPKAV